MSDPSTREEFGRIASEESESNPWLELWSFLKARKKWWLLPVLAVLGIFGALLALSGSGAAPFIYSLF